MMNGTGSETYHINPVATLPLLNESSDRKVLLVIQKYCTAPNCFHKVKLGKQVNAFYSRTRDMVQAEAKKSSPSSEQVFTILANFLLLLNNASAKSLEKLTVICYDTSVAMKQLEKSCHMDERYRRIQAAEQREIVRNKTATEKKTRIFRMAKRTILLILALMLLIFLSGFFLPKPPVIVEESKPFYIEAYDWVRFSVFGEKEPEITVPFSELYRPYTYIAGIIFLAISCICLIGIIGRKIYRRSKISYRDRIKRNWKEYQLLKTAFTEAEKKLTEMEE